MRTLTVLASVIALGSLVACTTAVTNSNDLGSKPISGTDEGTDTTKGGAENANGEHPGGNAPAGSTTPVAGGTTVQSDTWTGTKDVPANLTIAAGQTITISPGTVVTMGAGVAITVKGTLKVAAADNHAKMSGTTWQGLVIASGGTLDADGLEIAGADAAIWTQAGNTAASFKDGVITAATPFKMESSSKLTVDHSSVTASSGSAIAGTFVATFMTYDKTTAGGLTLSDAAGSMSITDSTLKGAGGGDYVICTAGTAVKVAYTTITGSHCGFHFSAVDKFTIDHTTVVSNSYGAMLYGSKGGTITSSNFQANSTVDIDFTKTANGPVTIDKSFLIDPTGITPTNKAAAAIADAQPRTP